MEFHRIQHVSIPRPPGSDEEARAFYGEVLGLEEVPPPQSLHEQDLIWYRVGDHELHLFAEDPVQDSSGRHFCLEVDDVEVVRARLAQAGYSPKSAVPIPTRPRFFCQDPFGNRIEFTTILGDYREVEVQQTA